MDDDQYSHRLHQAILNELGINEPPFQLKVELDVGSASVSLRDARSGVNDFGEGEPVWALTLYDLYDTNIPEKAREAADASRPHITPTPTQTT